MLSWSKLILRSLAFHVRIHGAVALGVAAATAVLNWVHAGAAGMPHQRA